MNNKNYLISVTGPTAVGKTNLSIEIAKNFNSEIISFDSRQFYKEMTIGTAVPDFEQLASVKHHFIQNKSIHDKYTVKDFSNESKNLIEKLFRKNNIIVLVGGSFLFLESIIYGLDEIPNIPKSVREDLNNLYLNKGINFLSNILKEKDIKYYNKIDNKNHRRVIRALEVIEHTGEKFSSFLNNNKKERYNHIQITLDCNRNVLYERINSRVDLMIENGLLNEVKKLYDYKDLGTLNTVGYKEIFKYLDNDLPLEESIYEIKKNTRRFAKRQLTWLRNSKGKKYWYDSDLSSEKIILELNKILKI